MTLKTTHGLSGDELSEIRDAVPALDLFAIRSLQRAGFQIVRADADADADPESHRIGEEAGWNTQGPVSSAA